MGKTLGFHHGKPGKTFSSTFTDFRKLRMISTKFGKSL